MGSASSLSSSLSELDVDSLSVDLMLLSDSFLMKPSVFLFPWLASILDDEAGTTAGGGGVIFDSGA